METSPVTCPSCFELFDFPLPRREETPSELDYDCEICCRPLIVKCWYDDGFDSVCAEAFGLEE